MMDIRLLCTACLCEGRKLYFIGETGLYNVYSQILNEIAVYDMSQMIVKVCFECRAYLENYQSFKERVKQNYWELLQTVQQNASITNVKPKLSNLQVYKQRPIQLPEDLEVKEERRNTDEKNIELEEVKPMSPASIKVEFCFDELDDNVDHHSEPEPFTNNLDIIQNQKAKKQKRPKKVKVAKQKKSKRKDIKAVKKKSDDKDAPLDCYKDKSENKRNKSDDDGDNSDIKVIHLTDEEVMAEREQLLRSDSFRQSLYKCLDCIVTFKDEEALVSHREKTHSESAGGLVCATCGGRTRSAPEMRAHVARHAARFSCALCAPSVSLSPSLSPSVSVSVSVSPSVSHWLTRGEVRAHLKLHHATRSSVKTQEPSSKALPQRPQCVECGKTFSSKKTYRYHLNVIHKGQNKFPCPQCGKIYQWKSNLWRHIKNHKAQDSGELYCSPCDKKFSSVATYKQHLSLSRRHISEREYRFVCSECGKKFVNKIRLKDHMDWEHLNKVNYRCQLCHKPFKSNTSLYVHMQNVHKNKEEKDNLCHVCGKSYQNIAKLKYHIVAMHTGATPYACELCPAAFSWYSSLYRHTREVHEKVKLKKPKKNKKDGEMLPGLMPPMMTPVGNTHL